MADRSSVEDRRSQSEADDRAIDAARPTLAQRGNKRLYHVGLVADSPFDVITVPTVVLRGTVRGKCVQVPKRTAHMQQNTNGTLVHNEGVLDGAFEELYDIEIEGFLKYCDTHVFRKTSDYEIPETVNGKATGKKIQRWRAEIEPKDPAAAGGIRSIHDETEVQGETLSNYVWITPARVGTNGRGLPTPAASPITAQRKDGTFFLKPVAPKTEKP